ncbi:MAG: hypothetical protein KME17_19730 [Cyanosarcina radialis HA8281-LM2]|jgi:hypothetical protein|nr:hypothetical protein [Cyanosarcina radialis HA8281-LM2]
MTPTLLGRWQTRILLLLTVGVLVTLPFAFGLIGPPDAKSARIYFSILGYVAGFGLIWDILYHQLQKFRWDADWPGIFQLFAGIWEAVFIAVVVKIFGLPGVSSDELLLEWFAVHYSLVWLAVYTASQTIMRILFIRWRFRGGQWL